VIWQATIGAHGHEAAIVAELKGRLGRGVCLAGRRVSAASVWTGVPDGERSETPPDTAQEVFLKVFRGMKHFHGESELENLDLPHSFARSSEPAAALVVPA